MEAKQILRLYKTILSLAVRYPSKNRKSIVYNIRCEFREGKNVTEPKQLQERYRSIQSGIKQLSMFTDLKDSKVNWEVTLFQDTVPPKRSDSK